MADFNQSDVNSMRQDAIRRVREMQRRSQNYIRQGGNSPEPQPPQQSNSQNQPNEQKNPQKTVNPTQNQNRNNNFNNGYNGNYQNPFAMFFGSGNQNFQNGQQKKEEPFQAPPVKNEPPLQKRGPISGMLENILPGINLDEDKIIIVFLIILLSREGADIKLLLALGYLLI